MKLPAGYVEMDRGSLRVVASRLELQEMVALLAGPGREERGGGQESRAFTEGGRGGTRRLLLAGGKVVYIRKYLRGGFVRHLTRDLYLLRPPRPLRELVLTEKARASGCAVPMVVAACVEEAGLFYRGWIVTAAVENSRSLFSVYLEADDEGRRSILSAAGKAIRGLHDADVYHVDLTGHNLLVDGGGRVWIIDFDKAFSSHGNVARLAEKGVGRFWRSMTKLGRQAGLVLQPDQRRWLERGYRG
ncbi:MAG: lipopolysaccharide kinase InaA family protein [Deltaproteobacteria bacterium]